MRYIIGKKKQPRLIVSDF